MSNLSSKSAIKLQEILKKRLGRELSQEELEQAYDALMGFAFALVDLDSPDDTTTYSYNGPIANDKSLCV